MLVITPAFNGDGVPGWFKGVYTVLNPLFKVPSVSPRECGDRVLFHTSPRFPARPANGETHPARAGDITIAMSSDGIRGGGASRVNWNGEEVPLRKGYKNLRKDEVCKKVWDHSRHLRWWLLFWIIITRFWLCIDVLFWVGIGMKYLSVSTFFTIREA